MANIKLTIEYAGTPYSGWQYQKDEKTVQGEIEKAIFKFSGEKKTIQGAGRTDAGVHALAQCANFNLDKEFTEYQILNGLNFHLGNEKIKISKVEIVSEDFNESVNEVNNEYHKELLKNQDAQSIIEETSDKDEVSFTKEAIVSSEMEQQNPSDLKEFGVDTNEPDLFSSGNETLNSEDLLTSSEDKNEDDDLEIPAFLRRQKN